MHWLCYRDKNKMGFLFLYSLPLIPGSVTSPACTSPCH